MGGFIPDEKLLAHQRVMLELLRQADAICRVHKIPYVLFAGTMLGAVRHRGFIPWDDDLDLLFLREDYDRFLAAAETELDPEKYYLQREFSPHWPMQSSKLRRNDTACFEKYYPRDPETHMGIYIDLFPCDNLSDSPLIARLQFLASKIVIAKALDARGYLTHSPAKKIFLAVSRLIPGKPLVRFVRLRSRTGTSCVHVFFGGAKRYGKSVFPRSWLEQRTELPFEGGSYPVSAHYEAFLRLLYGNYQEIPDANARAQKNHAFFVDPAHSYRAYPNIYDGVKFDVLTKSIR